MSRTRRHARRPLAALVRAWLGGLALLMVLGLAAVVLVAPSLAAATAAGVVDIAPDAAPDSTSTTADTDDDSSDDALLVPAATAPPRPAHAFAYARVARIPAVRFEPPSLPPPEA